MTSNTKTSKSIRKWYTQPPYRAGCEGSDFSSLYYYDKSGKNLVRIRLELGRTDKNNETAAFYYSNRYVGFYVYDRPGTKNRISTLYNQNFTVDKDGVVFFNNGDINRKLDTEPADGLTICDFSYENGKVTSEIHKGNKVITDFSNGKFPLGIREEELIALAEQCLERRSTIKLTKSNANSSELAQAIKKQLKEQIFLS